LNSLEEFLRKGLYSRVRLWSKTTGASRLRINCLGLRPRGQARNFSAWDGGQCQYKKNIWPLRERRRKNTLRQRHPATFHGEAFIAQKILRNHLKKTSANTPSFDACLFSPTLPGTNVPYAMKTSLL